jgi:hypothetical protein
MVELFGRQKIGDDNINMNQKEIGRKNKYGTELIADRV